MRPSGATNYRLMEPKQAHLVQAFLARNGWSEDTTLEFPTVLAWRAGQIVGMLSTRPCTTAIVAGPMVVGVKGNKAVVALRLGEAYEAVLRLAGIDRYVFRVSRDNEWPAIAWRRWRAEPYAEDSLGFWYQRRF